MGLEFVGFTKKCQKVKADAVPIRTAPEVDFDAVPI